MSLLRKLGFLTLLMSTNAWSLEPLELSFPQGIRDPVLPIAYVQTEKTVTAIRLSDGNTVWIYPTSGRPIAILDRRLVTQVAESKQAFRIVVIDKGTGALIIRSEPTFFSRTSGPGADFSSPPSISVTPAENTLLLEWQIRQHYTGGANPPLDFAKPSSASIVNAQMDLTTGKIQIDGGEASLHQNSSVRTEAPKSAISSGVRYNRNGQWSNTPWSTDGALISLTETADSGSLSLGIQKTKDAHSATKVQLGHDPVSQPPFVTGDGRYMMLQGKDGEWAVYSTIDGRQVGKFLASNMAEPCVVGDRVYYRSEGLSQEETETETSVLVAQDLTSGKILWSQALAVIHRRNRPKLPQ